MRQSFKKIEGLFILSHYFQFMHSDWPELKARGFWIL